MLQLLNDIPNDAQCCPDFVPEIDGPYAVMPKVASGKQWVAWFIEMVREIENEDRRND